MIKKQVITNTCNKQRAHQNKTIKGFPCVRIIIARRRRRKKNEWDYRIL
jgi:hypothetical protein